LERKRGRPPLRAVVSAAACARNADAPATAPASRRPQRGRGEA
jgi:hypothetical protein